MLMSVGAGAVRPGAEGETLLGTFLRDCGSAAGKVNPGGSGQPFGNFVPVSDQSSGRFSDAFDVSALSCGSIGHSVLTLTFANAGPSQRRFILRFPTERWQVRVQGSDDRIVNGANMSSDDHFATLFDAQSPQSVTVSTATDTGPIDAVAHSAATRNFAFRFSETTTGADAFDLDKADLQVFGAIPLPAGLPLFAGAAAVAFAVRRHGRRAA